MSDTHRTFGSVRRRISSSPPSRSDTSGMERHRDTDDRRGRARDDDAGLRGELGQTLALFGMALAVVLVGVLAGIGL
jgi:hypothetical protein